MKRVMTILPALLLAASLAACGSTADTAAVATEAPAVTEAPDAAEAPAASESAANSEAAAESEAASEDAAEGSSILVAYFSWGGNTRTVAEQIAAETGADIFEIATVDGYSEDYNTVLDEAQAEQRANARPELTATVENIDQYDTIFIGYPNWWGDLGCQ